MGREFHRISPYHLHFAYRDEPVRATVEWVINHGVVFIAEDEQVLLGMIGAAVTPHLMSGELTCGEVFWWVDPKARGIGLRLLRLAEAWGRSQGASLMTLVAPDADAEKLYERMKFQRVESAWQRPISD